MFEFEGIIETTLSEKIEKCALYLGQKNCSRLHRISGPKYVKSGMPHSGKWSEMLGQNFRDE